MKVIVRKTGKYNPLVGGLTKYQSICLLTLQKKSPLISEGEKVRLQKSFLPLKKDNPKIIYSSPLLRAKETARIIGVILREEVVIDYRLGEVTFELNKLLSEKEYQEYGSVLVRQRFMEAFITDSLLEKREEIRKRIISFMNEISLSEKTCVVIVSHSFLMKLMQIYFCDKKDIFNSPQLVKRYFDYRLRTFNYGEGFEFNF